MYPPHGVVHAPRDNIVYPIGFGLSLKRYRQTSFRNGGGVPLLTVNTGFEPLALLIVTLYRIGIVTSSGDAFWHGVAHHPIADLRRNLKTTSCRHENEQGGHSRESLRATAKKRTQTSTLYRSLDLYLV